MKVVVFGSNGLLGNAIVEELWARNHRVVGVARTGTEVTVDFRFDAKPEVVRAVVKGADIVINAVGVLIERDGNTWDVVHRQAAQALTEACEAERVARIIHVSALSAGEDIPGPFIASKQAAEQAVAAGKVDYAIVRAGLLVDEACPSTHLFRFVASLPVIALPGLLHAGASEIAPIQVSDVARCVARIAEHPKALRRVIELTGPETVTYREMLRRYREAQGKGAALWLPMPWWLMKLAGHVARWLPQKVFSADTMRMLQYGSVSRVNEAARWLGHEPLPMQAGAPEKFSTAAAA